MSEPVIPAPACSRVERQTTVVHAPILREAKLAPERPCMQAARAARRRLPASLHLVDGGAADGGDFLHEAFADELLQLLGVVVCCLGSDGLEDANDDR